MATGGVVAALLAAAATPASAREPFRNVLPAGQGETVDATELGAYQASGQPPATFLSQNGLYTGLVGAAPALKPKDLDRYFKPERFGVPADQVASEVSPRAGRADRARQGLQRARTSPATRAPTRCSAPATRPRRTACSSWTSCATPGRARLTELIGPGEDDANVKADAEQLKIADYDEGELQAMIDRAREAAGPEGATIQADLDAYVAGVNQYIHEARTDPSQAARRVPGAGQDARRLEGHRHRRDRVADRRHLRQGRRRRGEGRAGARRGAAALRRRRGPQGVRRLPLLRRARGAGHHTKRFPFDDPGRANAAAVAMPDPGSIQDRDPVVAGGSPLPASGPPIPGLPDLADRRAAVPARAVQRAAGRRQESKSGHPLGRHGPAGRLLLAEILMEIDLHGGGIDARGATFPGISLYVLIGRGKDFAWSTTTAYSDNVDEFVEKLCEPDGTTALDYLYKGQCVPFEKRDHKLTVTPAPTDPAARRRARSACRSCAACTARSRRRPRSAARRSRSPRRARPTGTRSTRSSPTSGSTPAR